MAIALETAMFILGSLLIVSAVLGQLINLQFNAIDLELWQRVVLGIIGVSLWAIVLLPSSITIPPTTITTVPTSTTTTTTTPTTTASTMTTIKPPTTALEIKITSPKEGDEVPVAIIVSGTITGELPEGQYMWVVTNPHPSPGQWWPQGGRISPWRGQWDVQTLLGREKEDIGKEFDIAVILVSEKDDQYYRDYLRTGQETGSYPGISLPASANIPDRITVKRK